MKPLLLPVHLLLAPLVSAQQQLVPTVTIDAGIVIGTAASLPSATVPVNQFLGIPFAQSPPERFGPPQTPGKWSEPLVAQRWRAACVQQFNYPEAVRNFTMSVFNLGNPEESEDCLYLNVYAPASPAPYGGRAVMFWIYGGSLNFGSAGISYYNGSAFAAYEDVILVAANYRTNVFGFPSSPELPLTERNLGFLDQRAALDWVQRNIASFGGDPNKVTIFGESAGGWSVDALLTSYGPNDNPPFRAGIAQSGQVSYRPSRGGSNLTDSWVRLATGLNCTGPSTLACVRTADALTIKSVIERQAISFGPIADNVTQVSDPASRRLNGQIKKLPTMSGTTANEGRIFQVGVSNLTAFYTQYFSWNTSLWPILTATYNTTSVSGPSPSPYTIAAQIFTEFFFQCPTAIYARASARAGIPTWRYYFNGTFPNTQPFSNAGAYHASEIPLVFTTWPEDRGNATAQQVVLGNHMRGAWASFARNPERGPGWGRVNGDVAILGSVGEVQAGGATIVDEDVVDGRCGLFAGAYEMLGWGDVVEDHE